MKKETKPLDNFRGLSYILPIGYLTDWFISEWFI
jgi:hypothetical protein